MAHYKYQIFVPGGNKTALVLGMDNLESNLTLRRAIQDNIMAAHRNDSDGEVEQVGFVSTDKSAPRLLMTGGEFCGNATRTAVAYYLDGSKADMEMVVLVDGEPKKLRAGVDALGHVWAEMPIYDDIVASVSCINNRFYWVKMQGISHLIVPQAQYNIYCNEIFENHFDSPKTMASRLLHKIADENSLDIGNACGIIFLENIADMLKMHPYVFIKSAGTTYYETGCGSGAMCVGLMKYMFFGGSIKLPLLQPSGKFITAEVERCGNGSICGKISGEVSHGDVFEVEVQE